MPDETKIKVLQERVDRLENLLSTLIFSDRYRFDLDLEMKRDVGTKIGLTANEKIGFYGKKPVAQWSGTAGNSGHYATGVGANVKYDDKFSGATNQGSQYFINDIVQALKDNGLIAT